MSHSLWKYFFDDDVDGFRHYLARATFDRNAPKGLGGAYSHSLKAGSPGTLATSPRTPVKSRKAGKIILTRSDINARDGFGRTLLHHAVSSRSDNAQEFVKVLLETPFLDLYVQDTESGWTALHRSLYSGNIAAAQALMVKDIQNATDYTTNVSHVNAGGLVKIKDHEGNSPFELFGLTTAPRDLQQDENTLDAAETASLLSGDMDERAATAQRDTNPVNDLNGEEVFAFGSNKNITLGLGDGDDRTFPERVQLVRPAHLMQHLFEDFQRQRRQESLNNDLYGDLPDVGALPAVVKNKPFTIQDVVMSKLHTAILTKDPVSNLHVCGFGPGGRLGTGDEVTRFAFTCIQGGGLAKRRVASVALGQDHTVVVCSSGEVFTWGSNKYGQLGYELPEVSAQKVPLQLTPRQIYGLIKKEQIIGAAASSLHSAIYTASGLYTFGKNEGQLGLMDADARSLDMQIVPRRVGVSIIQHPVQSVAAIDRATTVLLENHEVLVFTHYGFTKIVFPLDSFGSSIASDAFFARHNRQTKHISRITCGSNTICALTSYGEVFTVDVPRNVESVPNKSTTNPSKARNALPTPSKIWSIRKSHMAAADVAVGQDGSVILCTAAGTVWKKEKRAKIKSVHADDTKSKDYKFTRVPNIFGAIAVRSNSYGAFMAIRKDCQVMKNQIAVEAPHLWHDMFNLLAFREYGEITDDENAAEPQLRLWRPATAGPCPALIKRALLTDLKAEQDFIHLSKRFEPLSTSDYDVWITSNVTEVRLPVHSLILKARSKVLRKALAEFSQSYYFSLPDTLAIEYGSDGQIQIQLQGADFLTLTNFVFYLYTDNLVDVWRFTSSALQLAPRYRSVRTELMKIANGLEMRHLERAVRVMDEPSRCLREDFEDGFHDSDLFSDADVAVDLADGEERYAHSVVLQARCPFFEGLFRGHTGGMWMADRRKSGNEVLEAARVDLKHVDANIFEIVLRHIYADTGEELFDAVVTTDIDEFIDLVIDVMALANELMLGRLARICQKVIGQYVTPWNICGLLNTIAESSETEFKLAGLEYIGLNLENMLDQRLLEELDEYLLEELNASVQSNQLAFMPIARSSRALDLLLEQEPALVENIERCRQRRLDSMRLPSRYVIEAVRPTLAARPQSKENVPSRPPSEKRSVTSTLSPAAGSPAIIPTDDLQFEMEDEAYIRPGSESSTTASPSLGGKPEASQTRFPHLGPPGQSSVEQEGGLDVVATSPQTASLPGTPLDSGKNVYRPVWGSSTPTTPGLGLRDIMSQDSSVKVSNLTQSLKQAAVSSKQAQPRMSQKERKRQQQEQKLQSQAHLVEMEERAKQGPNTKTEAPQSPWQKVESKQTPVTSPEVTHEVRPTLPSREATSAASVQQPQGRNKKPSQPARSVSTPASTPGMTGFSKAPPPQIQSIRHTPTPAQASSWLDARTSMADILAQQQYEKSAIKESAAKRSLEEIQQEQEFQAWWDSESRRIQEEEAAVNNAVARSRPSRGGQGAAKKNASRGDGKAQRSRTRPGHDENDRPAHAEASHRGRQNGRGGFAGSARGRGNRSMPQDVQ
ncbi:hypothetical protein LTR64_002885 [Lithohypha guttulata]|uniref:uncharacterized protein n=1 Tax=Lithohypha guttulata TaxID=1690604 RepID=UPI002DDE5F7F|nr:hypothetical protein LTR51_000891 [Lithohypha guttulata]